MSNRLGGGESLPLVPIGSYAPTASSTTLHPLPTTVSRPREILNPRRSADHRWPLRDIWCCGYWGKQLTCRHFFFVCIYHSDRRNRAKTWCSCCPSCCAILEN
ncbi:unnamed protein product [Ectocarpus sp. 13 AM-2016]